MHRVPEYVVTIWGPPEDADALGAAAGELGDARVSAVIVVSDDVDETLVRVVVEEPTQARALQEARTIYQSLRCKAGLDSATGQEVATTARMNPLIHFKPKSNQFFQVADQMFSEENYLYTVVAVQTAFELYMEGAFDFALQLRTSGDIGDAVAKLLRGKYHLRDERVRDLWDSLTGHKVKASPSWQGYNEHVVRRNRLVHGGESVGRNEASASLSAVQDLASEVSTIVRQLMPRPNHG